MTLQDGIVMCGRISVGWNFHASRKVKTFGVALTYAGDRWLVTLGPLTFIWLL
jgi:hypothetical protein